ncbi:MAG: protein kinase [Myxococcaceae bacterium]
MQSELPGQTVGRFRIERQLGEGGMGVVFEAIDTASGRRVALKSVRQAEGSTDRASRLAREARLTEALDHPGIVRVLEVLEEHGRLYVVMELVEGQSLRARIDAARERGSPLEVGEALKIAREVAEAVAHAHQRGVVHRDLKPENVMLARDRARVLDFGLAKLREVEGGLLYQAQTQSNVTVEGQVLGTPAYMSPEQARGQEVGFRSDVFSLGVVLYELLTLQRPFTGASAADLIAAITRDDPAAPSVKNAQVPPAIDVLVKACLEKRSEARPSMDQLALRLAAVDLRPSKRFSRVPLLAGAVALLAIGGWAVHAMPGAKAAPVVAETPSPVADSGVGSEADRAFTLAFEDERRGDEDAALVAFERAVKLDPEHSRAHLWLALRGAFLEAENAREHFAQALARRDRLTPREDELVEALRPVFQRTHPDLDAYASAMRGLTDRHPDDARLLHELAKALDMQGDFDGAAKAAEQAIAKDPGFVLAFATLAQEQAYLGRFDDARATIATCLQRSPAASWCSWISEFISSNDGDCATVERRAHERVAADPTTSDSYKALAMAFAATGHPEKAVQEACDQAVQREPEGFHRQRLGLNLGFRIATFYGRLDDAERISGELLKLVASRTDAADHAVPTLLAAQIELELGHPEKAGAIAKDFLDRKDAWLANPVPNDYAVANDYTGPLLAIAYHSGALPRAEYEASLERWRAHWRDALRGGWKKYLWVYGYAQLASSKDEGAKAVAALSTDGPVPAFLSDGDLPSGIVGRALWLGGRQAEALPYLRAAAHSCDELSRPLSWVHAHSALGDALAGSGDVAGACEAYGVVVAHWGASKESVTARHAREQMAALRCPVR